MRTTFPASLPILTIVSAAVTSATNATELQPAARYRGSLSCSAAACHGGMPALQGGRPEAVDDGFGSPGGEYHVWSRHDPHSQSYQTLFTGRSERMIDRLARSLPTTEPVEPRRLELIWKRCLACHSADRDAPAPAVAPLSDGRVRVEMAAPLQDGVGCEACHGRATEPWFREHSRGGWRDRDPQERTRRGFIDMSNLLTRARMCVDCHVGSAGRDVNHDLLAAGHPVLRFELAGYSDLLPKHWNDERERRVIPWFEWRLWAAGQVAASATMLELLRDRARPVARGNRPPAWPEFAEYSCESCHHDLRQVWRGRRGFMTTAAVEWTRELGAPVRVVPPWQLWSPAVLPELVAAPLPTGDPRAEAIVNAVEAIRRQMQAGLIPQRESIVVPADTALARIERWRASAEVEGWLNVSTRDQHAIRNVPAAPLDRLTAAGIADSLLTRGHALTASWERMTQIYLMIAAWEQAFRDQSRAGAPGIAAGAGLPPEHLALQKDLRRLRELLAIPPGSADPAELTTAAADSTSSLPIRDEIGKLIERSLKAMYDLASTAAR